MTAEPMSCERCGEPHVRCKAHTKAGRPCGQPPMTGQLVCRKHGGKAPQNLAAAEERVQTEKAEAEIRKLWIGLENATAVHDPVASMAKLAGALENMLDQVGDVVNEIKTQAAGAQLQSVRGEIVLLERVANLLGRTLDSMARLGIAERQVELQAEQAALVSTAFRAVMGLVFVQSLLPGERDLMVRTFLTGIGAQLEALEASA